MLGGALDLERNGPGPARKQLGRLALDLGLKGQDGTRGHVLQACGAIQKFLEAYPHNAALMVAAPIASPYPVPEDVLNDWLMFIAAQHGAYGQASFGYSYDTLKGYLTPQFGGHRAGGGGGDHEFKVCFRLIPEL